MQAALYGIQEPPPPRAQPLNVVFYWIHPTLKSHTCPDGHYFEPYPISVKKRTCTVDQVSSFMNRELNSSCRVPKAISSWNEIAEIADTKGKKSPTGSNDETETERSAPEIGDRKFDLPDRWRISLSSLSGDPVKLALARAVYARTKNILLRDFLSALRLLRRLLFVNRTYFACPPCRPCPSRRLLHGRIDTHGTVEHLRTHGVLDSIEHDSTIETKEIKEAEEAATEDVDVTENTGAPKICKADRERSQGGTFLGILILAIHFLGVSKRL
ncbi:hypothetical protein HYPSUDRAFT_1094494 [Hypholoma sublateritium FD-334 SS-4]|uniref:Uncharacterized protein n=1 Tax=Hypholoma sublateritium (strain FD-334 SS-4) TaxID=945553 RepID=A0A0D2NLH2_HYPSF|nr:hypothetical protein HYPSUDRAFT_1094494 [Hypholoma sublateritium FD-334 SS-4]